ncbi:LysM peptidoglycan-binding domain-containing protein [Cellulomonas sp. PhB143]|uniref:LysM peptidoglycan-binding domain-containing protein n=1 Tax=Cellulomonas sp. PhB143 TaxID=2485186 RepID=UPI000F49E72A|nr:LysM peptidoglycan-binding domain-containing protein [Cellulomonas sp. PhB143]ROS77187.1 hypothetical protein EDF32_1184 [Cellulomonas sp. PhB143]
MAVISVDVPQWRRDEPVQREAAAHAVRARPVAAEVPTRLVLTRRGRAVLALLVAVLVALALGTVGTVAFADGPSAPVQVQRVTVAPGETLWELAGRVAASGDDRRDVVAQIQEINALPGATIEAGRSLLLPVGGTVR